MYIHMTYIVSTHSAVFPMSPQLGAVTLSRKSPAFQSPPLTTTAESPVNTATMDMSLGGKTPPPRVRMLWERREEGVRGRIDRGKEGGS